MERSASQINANPVKSLIGDYQYVAASVTCRLTRNHQPVSPPLQNGERCPPDAWASQISGMRSPAESRRCQIPRLLRRHLAPCALIALRIPSSSASVPDPRRGPCRRPSPADKDFHQPATFDVDINAVLTARYQTAARRLPLAFLFSVLKNACIRLSLYSLKRGIGQQQLTGADCQAADDRAAVRQLPASAASTINAAYMQSR